MTFMANEADLARKRLIHTRWRNKNREKLKVKTRTYDYKLKHGISFDEAEQLLKNQDGLCAICKNPISFDGTKTGAHLDHCHSTNIIRGILCQRCNHGLGLFKDNIDSLLNAINYLKKAVVSSLEKVS